MRVRLRLRARVRVGVRVGVRVRVRVSLPGRTTAGASRALHTRCTCAAHALHTH